MGMRLLSIRFLSYGALSAAGKVYAAIVLLLMAFVLPLQAEQTRTPLSIVAFGDSLTQGYGLAEDQGFVPQLRAWLEEEGQDVRVVNAGVSGDTTAGGLSRIEWTLSEETHGMILALGGNDLLRGLDPALTRANIEGILQAAQAADIPVLLVGMEAPGNYGSDFKNAFDSIWPELAQEYDTLYFPNFFEGLGYSDLSSARAYFQSDGIHPNAEGVGLIVDAIGPAVVELIAAAESNRALSN
ncbi:MAG: arylesterase [Rhodobacterales bacterium]